MKNPQTRQHIIKDVCTFVLGAAGGIGKTTTGNALAHWYQGCGIAVQMVRIETALRAAEFAPQDVLLDADRIGDAATAVGGAATLLEPVWQCIERALGSGGMVIVDAGANVTLVRGAGEAGLDELIVGHGRGMTVVVVTTPESEACRQAARQLDDVASSLPASRRVLVVNTINPAMRRDPDSPADAAYRRHLGEAAQALPLLQFDFAAAHSLSAFSASGRPPTIGELMRAEPATLMRWSGRGLLGSRACQSHATAWYQKAEAQFRTVFPCPGATEI